MYLTLKLFKSTYLQGKQDGWSQNAPEQWRRKQAQTRTEVGSCAVLTGSKSTFLWQSQRWKQVKQSSRWLWQRLSAAEGAAFLPESTLCSPLSGGYHSSLYASASETSPKGTCSSLWVLHHLQAPCSLCFLCRKANNSENRCVCVWEASDFPLLKACFWQWSLCCWMVDGQWCKITRLFLCHCVHSGFCLNFKQELPFQSTVSFRPGKLKFDCILFL